MPESKPKREKKTKISARLPAELASSLLAEAEDLNLTLSDVLRLKLSDADRSIVVTERKVQKVRREYTPVDPDLLLQYAGAGDPGGYARRQSAPAVWLSPEK